MMSSQPAPQLTQRIGPLTEEEFAKLPFGAVKLNQDGVILKYNFHDGRSSGREPWEIIGQNFFTQVAPATNIEEFAGRFREGIRAGNLDVTFPYRVQSAGKRIDVEITLTMDLDGKNAWVFVKQRQKQRI
jgi:photoactive yellow protein